MDKSAVYYLSKPGPPEPKSHAALKSPKISMIMKVESDSSGDVGLILSLVIQDSMLQDIMGEKEDDHRES